MGRMLSEPEIEALPQNLQDWYRTHEGLRSLDDLVWFPAAKRESLERIAERGTTKTIDRIRRLEGDEAADEAARELKAARLERAQRVAAQERRAS